MGNYSFDRGITLGHEGEINAGTKEQMISIGEEIKNGEERVNKCL